MSPPPVRADADTTIRSSDEPRDSRPLAERRPQTRAGRAKESLHYARGRGPLEIGAVYLLIIVVAVTWSIISPTFPFLSGTNLGGVLSQSIPVLAILAIGAGVLMVAGEFDLSLGAAIGMTAIVFIRMSNVMPWIVAFFVAIVVGVGVALINGLIVVSTRIPSFIATLGMSFVWTGASIFINGVTPAIFLPGVKTPEMTAVFAGNLGPFYSQFIWLAVVGVLAWLLLERHRWGNRIYAVGGNPAAAAAVSIKPTAVRLQAFAFLGVTTGLVGVLIAVRTSTMQPATTNDYVLLAVAAAVVGGVSLMGGRGTILGMIIGAALIRTIENILILAKAPAFYVQLFVGACIVVAAFLNRLVEGRAK